MLQPSEVVEDGEETAAGIGRVEVVQIRRRGIVHHVEPAAQGQSHIGQRREPRLRVILGEDRYALQLASDRLRYAAGNVYLNDKPTGAVVGQQPFGGARASGTNDKAGSMWNLIRWVSPRTIKETFIPPTDYRYPFMS